MHSKIAPLLVLVLFVASCGDGDDPAGGGAARELRVPGARVFPEGVAVDEATGDLYVGSTTDGTIFRSAAGREPFEVFLAAGEDGRTAATGLKIDPRGRLFVAGRSTGQLFVYALADRRLLARRRVTALVPG